MLVEESNTKLLVDPGRYSFDEEETEVPTFVLGQLRDQLAQSSHPGAEAAWTFIRELMGDDADTPVADLPSSKGAWISYKSKQVQEWCGSSLSPTSECSTGDAEAASSASARGGGFSAEVADSQAADRAGEEMKRWLKDQIH